MTECKHGMKSGCAYCQVPPTVIVPAPKATRAKRPGRRAKLSENTIDRLTPLK